MFEYFVFAFTNGIINANWSDCMLAAQYLKDKSVLTMSEMVNSQ
jgi:hypothetical protein